MSTPVPGVLSRRSHRRCARIRCAPPVARNATHSSHGAQEALLHAERDAPNHGHGRDQAVPRPADSLEGRQRGRSGQALPAAHRRGAERVVRGHGRRVHGEVRQRLRPLGCTVLHLAGPIELRRCRFGCAILGLGAGPSTSGHAADPPSADPLGGADMSLLQRAGVLQNTPYDA